MPTQKFALEREAPKRLEITWAGIFREMTVTFDGQEVGKLVRADLDRGADVALPDGSSVHIVLEPTGTFGTGRALRLSRNGAPLPGSSADPHERARAAGFVVYFVAGLNAFCGVLAMAADIPALSDAGIGVGALVMAGIFGVLGFFVMRRSIVALGLAITIFALDGIATLMMTVSAGGTPPIGMIFMRVGLLVAMGQGIPAMLEIRRAEGKG